MTNEKIKRMFDACYQAKRIREMLPPLPPGRIDAPAVRKIQRELRHASG